MTPSLLELLACSLTCITCCQLQQEPAEQSQQNKWVKDARGIFTTLFSREKSSCVILTGYNLDSEHTSLTLPSERPWWVRGLRVSDAQRVSG